MADDGGPAEQQKSAEAKVEKVQQQLGPFVVAAETTRMAMVFTDAKAPGRPIIFANDSFLALTGYARPEVLGQSFNFVMAPGTGADTLARIEAAFSDSSDVEPEVRYRRKDGGEFWASVFVSPVRDAQGDIVQHFASLMDLTPHRREQQRLKSLLSELNHRTQNTLATVLAIVGQTLRGVADTPTIDLLEGRILALSRAHILLGAENWDQVSLRGVLTEVLQPFGLNDRRRDRFMIEGDDARLRPKALVTLATLFHELATNAVKHGSLSEDGQGTVGIAWQVEATARGDELSIRWTESGGPPVVEPTRKGFGSRFIAGLAKDLGGDVRWRFLPRGLGCEIVMPVPRARADEA